MGDAAAAREDRRQAQAILVKRGETYTALGMVLASSAAQYLGRIGDAQGTVSAQEAAVAAYKEAASIVERLGMSSTRTGQQMHQELEMAERKLKAVKNFEGYISGEGLEGWLQWERNKFWSDYKGKLALKTASRCAGYAPNASPTLHDAEAVGQLQAQDFDLRVVVELGGAELQLRGLNYFKEGGEFTTAQDLRHRIGKDTGKDWRQLRLIVVHPDMNSQDGYMLSSSAVLAAHRIHAAHRILVQQKHRGGRRNNEGKPVGKGWMRALFGSRFFDIEAEVGQQSEVLLALATEFGGKVVIICKSQGAVYAWRHRLITLGGSAEEHPMSPVRLASSLFVFVNQPDAATPEGPITASAEKEIKGAQVILVLEAYQMGRIAALAKAAGRSQVPVFNVRGHVASALLTNSDDRQLLSQRLSASEAGRLQEIVHIDDQGIPPSSVLLDLNVLQRELPVLVDFRLPIDMMGKRPKGAVPISWSQLRYVLDMVPRMPEP